MSAVDLLAGLLALALVAYLAAALFWPERFG